ncbi:hypothetical protein BT96DRAFT_1003081 [Gymnopus androsaceus JB14]|uniref:Uncharacterized protein n=1 Tax=Gymnopus androsaceus JB14 TaxID=1447944 RepID=A0A6A4GUR0_9AGAR|nr:hypothetical protein BT96DRAFT_1003081 [Gymnopus androsaceus JB14]
MVKSKETEISGTVEVTSIILPLFLVRLRLGILRYGTRSQRRFSISSLSVSYGSAPFTSYVVLVMSFTRFGGSSSDSSSDSKSDSSLIICITVDTGSIVFHARCTEIRIRNSIDRASV